MTFKKILLIVLFLLGWFSLIAQFIVNINSGVAPPFEIVLRYFSYFTLNSNLIVTLCVTSLLFQRASGIFSFFRRQSTQTAAAVYIFVVFLIYNIILRGLLHLSGIGIVLDEFLHLVIPLLFLFYWFRYTNRNRLTFKVMWWWLIFPMIYITYVLLRSPWSGFYPYPFLNIAELGLHKVLLNCVMVTGVILITSIIFLFVGNKLAKEEE